MSFTSLRLLYNDAVANFRDGQKNSVLVITAGPHTDRSLDGPGMQEFIKATFAPARPVAVNVIDFGDDADRPTWEAVAQSTGGSYQNLSSSDRARAYSGDHHDDRLRVPRLGECLHRRARTDQVAVAVGAVDATHRRPHLGAERLTQRVRRLFAAVRVRPLVGQ